MPGKAGTVSDARITEPLKPCPFCGGTDVKLGPGDESAAWVECACGAGGPMAMQGDRAWTQEELERQAVDGWNKRAPVDTVRAQAARCPNATCGHLLSNHDAKGACHVLDCLCPLRYMP